MDLLDLKYMAQDKVASISQSRSLEEMANFWDSHSLADFEDQTYEVEMTFNPRPRNTTVDATLAEPLSVFADLEAMHLLSDQALQAAAQPSLSPGELHRLRHLNHTAGERSLTQTEEAEQTALLNAYHMSVLRRAQALAILTQWGHEMPYRTSLEVSADDESLDS